MSSSILTIPDMAADFEGPKVTRPGMAILDADKESAMRSGALQKLLQSVIDQASAIVADGWKQPCRIVVTTNITLAGLQTLDGITLAFDDRVLVVGQSAPTTNGIWLARPGSWARPGDANSGSRILGTIVGILEGTLGAGSTWRLATSGSIGIGSTPLVFTDVFPSSRLVASNDGSAGTPAVGLGAGRGLFATGAALGMSVASTERFRVETFGAKVFGSLIVDNSGNDYAMGVRSGTPEGATTGSPGDEVTDATNGRKYLKRTGTGTNTGWLPIALGDAATWTATMTAITNLDSVTFLSGAYVVSYGLAGEIIVTGSIRFAVDPTASGGISFRFSPPLASNFTSTVQAWGSVSTNLLLGASGVTSDATNDQLVVTVGNSFTTAYDGQASFQYRVLP